MIERTKTILLAQRASQFVAVMAFVVTILVSLRTQAEQEVFPAINGMTVQLADVVQTVKIQVQSLGPGACAAWYYLGSDKILITALPVVWSEWVEFPTAYIGEATLSYSQTVICDTGALAKLKYEGK